ncbi:MAG: hypothetical protein J6W96_04680 [Alphaproteobacteria bacterium]|nr:hypothetical protein [Alphaproteobacteria bacterium]
MKKHFLVIFTAILLLVGCANERLSAINEQYREARAEIPNNCFFLSDYFKYDNNEGIQYVSSIQQGKEWYDTKKIYQTLTADADDNIFHKLLEACEICAEERPEDAVKYMKYKESILKVQRDKDKKIKAAKITEEEELKKKREEEAKKLALSKKYNAEWCDGGILSKKNRCLLEGEFQIFEQQEAGTLVKPRINMSLKEIQMLAAFSQLSTLMSMTTGEPDELNRDLNDMADEMQQLVFIESNAKDSNQIDGAIVKGLFLRDGVYKYDSLSGTRTVKKIKRLQ